MVGTGSRPVPTTVAARDGAGRSPRQPLGGPLHRAVEASRRAAVDGTTGGENHMLIMKFINDSIDALRPDVY